jgi:hypothetical protein
MAKKNLLSTGCSDWQLGWGLGGNDKLGRLTLEPLTNEFVWKGYSQGRHGDIWNKGAFLRFTVQDDKITILGSKGNYPVQSELLKAVNITLQQQMTK